MEYHFGRSAESGTEEKVLMSSQGFQEFGEVTGG